MCEEGYRAPHTKAPVIHIECSEDGRWVNILDPTAPVATCESKYAAMNYIDPLS